MAIQSDHEFAPTQIARAVFPTAFRGYDQDAVRRYLSRLAAALEHQQEYAGLGELEARTPAHERVEELEAEIESLQDEIKDLELELVQRSVDGPDRSEAETDPEGETNDNATFDEHRAIELLGKETARVLESARSAASDILKRAETQAASLKAQAKSELAEARKRADSLVTQKQAETEELVDRMTSEAEAAAQRVTTEADEHRAAVLEEASKILTEAEELSEAEQAEAEERAKQIVADAETLRQQVIAELVVERRDAQSELDRVAAARDRLAMSLAVARSELDEVADALVDSPAGRHEPSAARTGSGSSASSAGVDSAVADAEGDGTVIETSDEAGIEAEVDGLIESLESEAEPQELGLVPPVPSDDQSVKSGKSARAKKKQQQREHKAKSKNGATAKAAGHNGGGDSKSTGQAKTDAESEGPRTAVLATEPAAGEPAEADAGNADVDPDTATDTGADLNTDADTTNELELPDLDSLTDGDSKTDPDAEADLEADDYVQVININPAPEEGQELSLVQGFTTLEVNDSDSGPDQDSGPARGSDTGQDGGQSSSADDDRTQLVEVIDLTAEHAQQSEGADEDPALVYSVLVNEPQSPDEVITTVASRTATAQRDRTRGDLLIEEAFTGRLPKPFAARDVALTRSGPNFRRQLRRALNDDQSDVLDRLRAGRGAIKVEELPAFGDQIDRYLAPLRRGLAEIAQAGARAGGQSDLSQSALDNLVRQLAKYIVDKVRVPTIRVVEETADQDRERILEPIRALYRDFRNVGLPDLTEDALYEAFAIGLYDSIEPAAPVRWMADPRCDPDPVCEINRARDDIAKGEVFPSGHTRPLSLPGCRCLVVVAAY